MMKHRAFTIVEAIVVILIICILAVILFPVFTRPRDGHGHRSPCQSNLKQLALGVKQYIQDYDEKYPPTQNATGGWADLIFPYVKSTQLFHCPTDKTGKTDKTTDYFYNARLSGADEGKLDAFSITILMGDGAGDSAPSYSLSQLPDAWRRDQNSPAWRHLDGANYLLVNGNVKWLKPEKITSQKPSPNQATFEVKP